MGIVSGKEAQRSVGPEEAVGSPRVPRRAGAQTSPTRIAANRVSRAPANPQTSSFPANPSSSHRPNAAKAAARERERPPGLSPPGTVCVWSRHSRSLVRPLQPRVPLRKKIQTNLRPKRATAHHRISISISPSPGGGGSRAYHWAMASIDRRVRGGNARRIGAARGHLR